VKSIAKGSRLARLLLVARHQPIIAPDADSGIARVAQLAGGADDAAAWLDVTAEGVEAGLLRDPVRLPQGALQCHWHLELTPVGIEAARRLEADEPDPG
jgi:hypothetical protein